MLLFRQATQGVLVLVTGALFFGCSGTIFERANMDSGDSFFLDARQRVISNITLDDKQYKDGQIAPKRIICAEPSPDVALAMARSLGAGVNVFGYGSGNVSNATSEALAQLGERFAAVQLLRDILYRSCEAYANGAFSSTTYALMMARLDETTTTLLLGEMAAGAFGRQLGAAQSAANAKAIASLTESRNTPLKPGDGAKTSNSAAPAGSGAGGAAPGPGVQAVARQMQGNTETDVAASGTVLAGLGTITGRTAAGEVAGEVAKIHKAFLDDDNLDALLVACITSLSHEPVQNDKVTRETSLSKICKEQIFNKFIDNAKNIIAAKANAEVLVARARVQAGYVESFNKCLDAFKNDAKLCAPLLTALSAFDESSKPTPVAAK